MLKPVLIASYAVMAGTGVIAVACLLQPSPSWVAVALVVHAILMGWAGLTANFFEWEILARGVEERR